MGASDLPTRLVVDSGVNVPHWAHRLSTCDAGSAVGGRMVGPLEGVD